MTFDARQSDRAELLTALRNPPDGGNGGVFGEADIIVLISPECRYGPNFQTREPELGENRTDFLTEITGQCCSLTWEWYVSKGCELQQARRDKPWRWVLLKR
jgi:hypothetical protein